MGRSRKPRILGGLSMDNIIDNGATETTEVSSEDELHGPQKSGKCATRPARNRGTAPVNYDSKFHPMDVFTRPNSRVTQRHRSRSNTFPRSDSRSDEESPSSGPEDDREDEDEEGELPSEPIVVYLTPRTPDAAATRHSKRSEAKKAVNYSSKHHPQDHGLPGYRHRALLVPIESTQSSDSKARKRTVHYEEDDEDEEKASRVVSTSRKAEKGRRRIREVDCVEVPLPHKELRSLDDNARMARKKQKKRSKKQSSAKKRPGKAQEDVQLEGIDYLADWAIQSMQRAPREPTPLPDEDEIDQQMMDNVNGFLGEMANSDVDDSLESNKDVRTKDVDELVEFAIQSTQRLVQQKSNQRSEEELDGDADGASGEMVQQGDGIDGMSSSLSASPLKQSTSARAEPESADENEESTIPCSLDDEEDSKSDEFTLPPPATRTNDSDLLDPLRYYVESSRPPERQPSTDVRSLIPIITRHQDDSSAAFGRNPSKSSVSMGRIPSKSSVTFGRGSDSTRWAGHVDEPPAHPSLERHPSEFAEAFAVTESAIQSSDSLRALLPSSELQ